jgi:ankyrin repeat protein
MYDAILNEHPIFIHVAEGNRDLVEAFYNNDPAIINKQTNKDGNTLEHIAAYFGHLPIIEWLHTVRRPGGPDVVERNEGNKQGTTPLMLAAQQGHLDIVDWYLQTDPTRFLAKDNNNANTMLHAAKNEHMNIVRHLVNFEKKWKNTLTSIFEKNIYNEDAFLYTYLYVDDLSLLKWLIVDQSIEFQDYFLEVLCLAAKKGDMRFVQQLISKGGKELLDTYEQYTCTTPFLAAVENGHLDLVIWMIETAGTKLMSHVHGYGKPNALMCAAKSGQLEIVKWLHINADRGYLNTKDANGKTTLMHALSPCSLGDTKPEFNHVANFVLNESEITTVIEKDNQGRTALMYAAASGDLSMLIKIVNRLDDVLASIHISAKDIVGHSVFVHALLEGHVDIAKWLIEHYPKFALEKNNYDIEAIRRSAYKGNLQMVEWLVRTGKEGLLNTKNLWKNTPFMHAVAGGHLPMVQWFIEKGGWALFEDIDTDGKTAFHHAIIPHYLYHFAWKNICDVDMSYHMHGSPYFIEDLLKLAAKSPGKINLLTQEVSRGTNALMLAAFYHNSGITSYFMQKNCFDLHHKNEMNESVFTVLNQLEGGQIAPEELQRNESQFKTVKLIYHEYLRQGKPLEIDISPEVIQVLDQEKNKQVLLYALLVKRLNEIKLLYNSITRLVLDYLREEYYLCLNDLEMGFISEYVELSERLLETKAGIALASKMDNPIDAGRVPQRAEIDALNAELDKVEENQVPAKRQRTERGNFGFFENSTSLDQNLQNEQNGLAPEASTPSAQLTDF